MGRAWDAVHVYSEVGERLEDPMVRSNPRARVFLRSAGLSGTLSLCALSLAQGDDAAWDNFGGHAAHTGLGIHAPQRVTRVRWTTPVDEDPPYSGADILA